MAVTFVIGNTNLLDNVSLFSPGNSITSALANEFAEAGAGPHTAALMELGLILSSSPSSCSRCPSCCRCARQE